MRSESLCQRRLHCCIVSKKQFGPPSGSIRLYLGSSRHELPASGQSLCSPVGMAQACVSTTFQRGKRFRRSDGSTSSAQTGHDGHDSRSHSCSAAMYLSLGCLNLAARNVAHPDSRVADMKAGRHCGQQPDCNLASKRPARDSISTRVARFTLVSPLSRAAAQCQHNRTAPSNGNVHCRLGLMLSRLSQLCPK